MQNVIHLIGLGGQGKAWAPSLREANFPVKVYLQEGSKSFERARALGVEAFLMKQISENLNDGDVVVFGCPDRKIGEVYTQFISDYRGPLHLVLIHGYAVWSGDLPVHQDEENLGLSTANDSHTVNLLAPKAIGPELRAAIYTVNSQFTVANAPRTTPLKAAFFAPNENAKSVLLSLATEGLKFSREHLIPGTFDQETVGDLISEQLLLCGGLFSLLEWTVKEMKEAGIPDALIQEECITELELVARVLKTKGLKGTVDAISDSAKAGAVMMRKKFIEHKLPELLHEQAQEVINKKFLTNLLNDEEWKKDLEGAFKT